MPLQILSPQRGRGCAQIVVLDLVLAVVAALYAFRPGEEISFKKIHFSAGQIAWRLTHSGTLPGNRLFGVSYQV
jgi:hypothetical protein